MSYVAGIVHGANPLITLDDQGHVTEVAQANVWFGEWVHKNVPT